MYLSEVEKKPAAGPREKKSEQLLSSVAELVEFVSDSARLIRGDLNPLELPPVVDKRGVLLPNYYVLISGGWRGYYRLDYVAKVGVGVIALHEDSKLQDKLARLLEDAAKKL